MIDAILDNLRTYWIVHVLLLAYTAVLAHHAWSGNRRTRGVADYFVGGRSMGPIAIGLSFFATYSSTNSFVGFSGQAYDWGVTWFLLIPFVVGLSLLAWVAVAPRLRTFTESLGSLTIPDFIGFRFGSPAARVMAAAIILFASFFYMTAVFKGIGNLLEVFLDIPYRAAIIIVFFIVMLYTVVGGFISVVKTDAVQGVVMIVAGILLFRGTMTAAGGFGSLAALAEDPVTEPLLRWGGGVAVPLALGVVFAGTVKFVVEPRQLSRFYALESRAAARKGVWVSTAAFLLVYSLLIPVGLYARNIMPGGLADTDLVVPQLLTMPEVFSAGTGAFLLLAMVAAAMSSVDSVLLVMASTTQRDLVGMWREPVSERATLRATRFYVALFALITAVIALNPPDGIVGLTAFSGAVYGACFAPALLMGLYWRRGNGRAAVASFVTGLVVLVSWDWLPWADSLHQVFPGVALSFLVYWVVARWTPGYESAEVDRLFEAERKGAADRT
ncbi:MAG: sodium/solute symporter [Gemmatimonadetes bacterium]|nr:sodium/solute symporter [Gemmatimonadota bacterium]MYA63536.1 sodium/solute symporter [Gemmatimonadota bacterium]MYB97813.1 sodium/solute symporter [Gemmatimonadota bacterium]MYH51363.1 sodium/solute symporter [Gemmatimonadota bacterium]MYK65704.1 sodium/solute symporter [Gemmatimonadota bacterium]